MRYLKWIAIFLFSCSFVIDAPSGSTLSQEFKSKWFNGLAEVNIFELSQARYGEIHKGTTVLIFVKEKLDLKTLVKLDDADKEGIEVLKCNLIKKFRTGVYDYSMLNTSLTAIEGTQFNKILKSSASVQDWCGHTYSEFKNKGSDFEYLLSSYFEGETVEKSLDVCLTEDGLLNQLRIDPNSIPLGKMKVIPSMFFLRLRHKEFLPYQAEITMHNLGKSKSLNVNYPALNRSVIITFDASFPYEILEMQESYESGWGESAATLTTTARRISVNWLEYWKLHNSGDSQMRTQIGLD